MLFARKIRGKLATTWSVGETGTAGPTGSRYGHAAGHSCIAVIGPNGERSITVETGNSDRVDNMRAFYDRRARSAGKEFRRVLIRPPDPAEDRLPQPLVQHGVAADRAPERRIPQAHIPPASSSRPGVMPRFRGKAPPSCADEMRREEPPK